MIIGLSKNNSNKCLIKEKTKQQFYYHRCAPKTTKNIKLQTIKINKQIQNDNQFQTSIVLQNDKHHKSNKFSEDKQYVSSEQIIKEKLQSNQQIDKKYYGNKRFSRKIFKSLEIISSKKSFSPSQKQSFSIRKLHKSPATASQPKLQTIEKIETYNTANKNLQRNFPAFKSQQELKYTLKKSSASKLKLKVFDPFEKRSKLDVDLLNQTAIKNNQTSFISTVNQEQFRYLLQKITQS